MSGNSRKVIAFIGIGSNIGDAGGNCRQAIRRLSQAADIMVLRQSSLYSTEPVGKEDQQWFVNCAVEIRTALGPGELLEELKNIESAMGREPPEKEGKWGPRIIDLDVLLYGQDIIEQKDLLIPHPELHKRRFVLEPLNEIAPYVIHPVFGISVKGLLDRLDDDHAVTRLEN